MNLRILRMNNTAITDLNALAGLPHIERIYCDQTKINRSMADAFMASKRGVLVIFDSKDLKGWWESLPPSWQKVFRDAAKTGPVPSSEELAKITNLDSINVADNPEIVDVEPLQRLQKIQSLNVKGTGVKNLSSLQEYRRIRTLDISNTDVNDISVLQQFSGLTVLKADHAKIQNLDALSGVRSIKRIYADDTGIQDSHVQEFLSKNPDCLVVYKTDTLLTWWNELADGWKGVFKTHVPVGAKSQREDLHRLIELESLQFKDVVVEELSSLGVFIRLKELHFSGTALSDLSPLANFNTIKSLHATSSAIRDLSPLSAMSNLEDLNISNTPVEELGPLGGLEKLRELNCSGTQVSSLGPLQNLSLESLDCSNTNVKKLEPLYGLPLKTLKCYNTRASSKEVDKFKSRVPDCNVVYYR